MRYGLGMFMSDLSVTLSGLTIIYNVSLWIGG